MTPRESECASDLPQASPLFDTTISTLNPALTRQEAAASGSGRAPGLPPLEDSEVGAVPEGAGAPPGAKQGSPADEDAGKGTSSGCLRGHRLPGALLLCAVALGGAILALHYAKRAPAEDDRVVVSGCELLGQPCNITCVNCRYENPSNECDPSLRVCLPEASKITPLYREYWVRVQGRGSRPAEVYPAEKNARMTRIAVPAYAPAPEQGWPYVIYLMFMLRDGYSDGWGSRKQNGMMEGRKDIRKRQAIQALLHDYIKSGYAVIMTSEWASDSYFYSECNKTDPDSICWNDGNNPDRAYLEVLFNRIYRTTVSPAAGNMTSGSANVPPSDKGGRDGLKPLVEGVKFSYNNVGLFGYSVGAQMVSRAYNDFPSLRTHPDGQPFPAIAAGAMLAGGSLHCYQYCVMDTRGRCGGEQPAAFLPCAHPERGCCPHNLTEPVYDHGSRPWHLHPPTVLIQSSDDNFADPRAAEFYFNSLQRRGVPALWRTQRGSAHNLKMEEVQPTLEFFTRFMGIDECSEFGSARGGHAACDCLAEGGGNATAHAAEKEGCKDPHVCLANPHCCYNAYNQREHRPVCYLRGRGDVA